MTVVGGSSTVGNKLKSTSGWSSNGNGTDEFGFSALPGGGHYADGGFSYAGDYGHWWTATEDGSSNAYYRVMYYHYDDVYEGDDSKDRGYSVRCVGGD